LKRAGRCSVRPRCVVRCAQQIVGLVHAKAGRILENLRRAMSSRARLLVVEYVIPDHVAVASGNGVSLGKWLDLHMMVAAGGLERTEADYRRLFADHGFRLTRVVPTAGDISVIEGRPA
jgi:hypothetical protein